MHGTFLINHFYNKLFNEVTCCGQSYDVSETFDAIWVGLFMGTFLSSKYWVLFCKIAAIKSTQYL